MQIIGIIVAVISFLLLVVVHEGGHFLAAKACGVGVPEFSVGFGPLIYETKKGETQYSIRAIPVGGYCRLEGEEEEEDSKPDSLNRAPWYKQIIIMAAGPFFNIVLCLAILFAVFLYSGTTTNVLAAVTPGEPAAEAGLQAGDEIISIDDTEISTWSDFRNIMNSSEGDVDIGYIRDGNEYHTTVFPEYSTQYQRRMIGVTCSFAHSPKAAAKSAVDVSISFFASLRDMFVSLFHGDTENVQVSGVVGIVSVVSEEVQYGIINVIYLMGIISLNLGVMNLLPIPALDGGRILFVIIKALSRNRIPQEYIDRIHAGGMLFLWSLMIVLIFKDTFNLIAK